MFLFLNQIGKMGVHIRKNNGLKFYYEDFKNLYRDKDNVWQSVIHDTP